MKNKEIFISLVTTDGKWKEKLDEINKFNLKEIALFPTILDKEGRKCLYKELGKSCVKSIPHVHLRHDMEKWELEYFIKKYNTQVFNIHPGKNFVPKYDLSDYRDVIFVENAPIPTREEVKRFGGLCIDFTHWHDYIKKQGESYDKREDYMLKLIGEFKAGCGHISAIKEKLRPSYNIPGRLQYEDHYMNDLKELDYIKKYIEYLPNYISIELENSIKKQLRAKEYLEKIIYQ